MRRRTDRDLRNPSLPAWDSSPPYAPARDTGLPPTPPPSTRSRSTRCQTHGHDTAARNLKARVMGRTSAHCRLAGAEGFEPSVTDPKSVSIDLASSRRSAHLNSDRSDSAPADAPSAAPVYAYA